MGGFQKTQAAMVCHDVLLITASYSAARPPPPKNCPKTRSRKRSAFGSLGGLRIVVARCAASALPNYPKCALLRMLESIVGTHDGVFRAGAIRRKPPEERWSASYLQDLKGCPQQPVPGRDSYRMPNFVRPEIVGGGDRMPLLRANQHLHPH